MDSFLAFTIKSYTLESYVKYLKGIRNCVDDFSLTTWLFTKRFNFLNYVDGKKYILWCPTTHNVIVSQYVMTLSDEDCVEENYKNLVCYLHKLRYDLTQASGYWYKQFDSFIMSSEF